MQQTNIPVGWTSITSLFCVSSLFFISFVCSVFSIFSCSFSFPDKRANKITRNKKEKLGILVDYNYVLLIFHLVVWFYCGQYSHLAQISLVLWPPPLVLVLQRYSPSQKIHPLGFLSSYHLKVQGERRYQWLFCIR